MTDVLARASTLFPASRAGTRVGAVVRRILGDRSGGAAVEFAIVSAMLIFTILFVMYAGLIVYMSQALDYATARASRQIMTGYVQKNGIGASDFRTTILCPSLPASMSCGNVILNVQTLSEAAQPNGYYQFVNGSQTGLTVPTLSNAAAQYDPGTAKSYVYVQAIYPITVLPGFLSTILGPVSV